MPPKQWQIEIKAYPRIREGHDYLMLIETIAKSCSPRGVRAVLKHLSDEQSGREHTMVLRSVFPGNLAGAFFLAAGMEVAVGQKLAPNEAVGKEILVRFSRDPKTGSLQPSSFKPLPPAPAPSTNPLETNNGRSAHPSRPAAQGPSALSAEQDPTPR